MCCRNKVLRPLMLWITRVPMEWDVELHHLDRKSGRNYAKGVMASNSSWRCLNPFALATEVSQHRRNLHPAFDLSDTAALLMDFQLMLNVFKLAMTSTVSLATDFTTKQLLDSSLVACSLCLSIRSWLVRFVNYRSWSSLDSLFGWNWWGGIQEDRQRGRRPKQVEQSTSWTMFKGCL